MRTRIRWASIGLTVLLVLAVATMFVSSRVGLSETQAAANASPPPAGPTTAQVEERALSQSLSLRGAITAPSSTPLYSPVTASEQVEPVVSGVYVEPGQVLQLPTAVADVAGRPLIVAQGNTRFYRDLIFGDSGRDVSQLQQVLGVRDTGVFDGASQNALEAFYQNLGYSAPTNSTPSGEVSDDSSIEALQDAVEDAQISGDAAVASAELALAGAQQELTDGVGTQTAADQARLTLMQAQSERDRLIGRAERSLQDEINRVSQQNAVAGVRFESSELTVVPFPSTTVINVGARVGQELAEGQAVVTLGDPVLKAVTYVGLGEAQQLSPGLSVSVTASTLPASLSGVVSEVASEPTNVDAAGVDETAPLGGAPTVDKPFRVVVDFATQPASTTVGSGVLLTIAIDGTGTQVVAVPLVALQQQNGADVVVTYPDNRVWPVETGFSAEGWVELTSGAPPVGSLVETR